MSLQRMSLMATDKVYGENEIVLLQEVNVAKKKTTMSCKANRGWCVETWLFGMI